MVAFNMLWKLCLVVAFGLSATATSTDVDQEQPKKESFVSRFFGKKEEAKTQPVEVQQEEITKAQENTDAEEPPKFSVEWYLLPKPINRATLRDKLPWIIQNTIPRDCNQPIASKSEELIREYIPRTYIRWYLLPEPESRTALRYSIPKDLANEVPEDYNEPIKPEVVKRIKKFFSLSINKQKALLQS
ncbi:SmORF protein [Babesia bovis T2Bo]|uniref:SmORF n=1 Tax=Babesia bovis TaxID=5865 RepID=A7AXD6_BABBO|nr:SmORF protein [Babesia bovis T2Bo]EDO05209.1 SmORF protein [Babesia bovis T2Bo]|eukprot:XP_001608777.1 SmORF [Babesia bovis T2Bo]